MVVRKDTRKVDQISVQWVGGGASGGGWNYYFYFFIVFFVIGAFSTFESNAT